MTLIVSIRMEEFAWRSSGCRRNAMRNLSINRSPILYVAWAALLALASCVSSIPSNFHYETSVNIFLRTGSVIRSFWKRT